MGDWNFIYWIANIRKALRKEFEDRASGYEITICQFQVLKRLWQGDGIPTTYLSKDIASDGGTVTGVLDRLESRGYLRRERSAEDRREVHIYITPEGKALEGPLMEILQSVNDQTLESLNDEEKRQLNALLAKIGGSLGIQ